MHRTLIHVHVYLPESELQHGLLVMANLVGPLIGVKDTSKVEKSPFVLNALIDNILPDAIVRLPRKKTGCPIECNPHGTLTCMLAKIWTSALMMAYFWSTDDGETSWTIKGCQGHR